MPLHNRLNSTTSPYLLQHAHNPIDWYPWGEEAFCKAKQEDKPILLSIGYAACHWCHVMAKESFEDEEVAAVMNNHFINIKVDREENPDVDQVAIAAMQAMGIQVGWPLHIFLMPNQQPFYGCTYLSTVAWKQLLNSIVNAFKEHRLQLLESSFYFTKTLQQDDIQHPKDESSNSNLRQTAIQQIFQKIYENLDLYQGGIQGGPKFPLPSISMFLLQYYRIYHDKEALQQLDLTLTKMAYGGIYDHLGGGFYRYTTDEAWKIPHFEKMLYDNAQLVSLYSHAYMATKNSLYKHIVKETVAFVLREMLEESGGFCSSIDADSQGQEGAFYTWTYQEIEKLLQEDTDLLTICFSVIPNGNWHSGLNILYRSTDDVQSDELRYQPASTESKLSQAKEILYNARERTRIKPSLDTKVIASWNGMMLQALIDAYYALGEDRFLEFALKNAAYLEKYLIKDNQVWHSYSQGKHGRVGYLEDYAWLANAFISLYEATLQDYWIYKAEKLVQYILHHFTHEHNNLFYFTDVKEPIFIKRTQEILDQVIPSSNAIMAHNLYRLGNLLKRESYTILFHKMLGEVAHTLQHDALYMTYWANLHLLKLRNIPIVVIIGAKSTTWAQIIKRHYPEVLLAGAACQPTIPWLTKYKMQEDKTTVYVCDDTACYAPLYSLEEVLKWLSKWRSKQTT